MSLRALRALRSSFGAVLCCVLCAVPALAQQTHILVVTGVPGDEDHAKKFSKWAVSFIDAAKKKDAVPDANITLLADPAPMEPKGIVLGRSTKAGVEEAIGKIASRAKATDTIFILLVGHGSFDGRVASFNLSGPDLTAGLCQAAVALYHPARRP
jgi:hypothetical protein